MSSLARITTGNAEADLILGGGFPANSINIVMGEPGTGKTLFVEQLLFFNAAADRPVLYLTTLSEPLSKVITYLQQFQFFDETKLGTSVIYEDLGAQLVKDGPDALLTRLREVIETIGPKIIVIDSFKAIHDLSSSTGEMRRLVSQLGGLLSAYAATTFLVGEYRAQDVAVYPEFAMADGILEFARQKRTSTDERFVRVSKLRGSSYLEGLHGIHITGAAIQFYPRLVSPTVAPGYQISRERVPTGVPGLDPLLGGGIWRGSATMIVGPTGGGKTTMGLQFALAGAADGEPALFVHFQENPSQLSQIIQGLLGDRAGRRSSDLPIHFLYTSAVELQIDRIILEIFRLVETQGIRRVVIDAVGDLAMAAGDPQRIHDYLYALIQRFATMGITSYLLMEDTTHGPLRSLPGSNEMVRLSNVCDNLFLLSIARDQRMRRGFNVYKTRASHHDEELHGLTISEAGVRVE